MKSSEEVGRFARQVAARVCRVRSTIFSVFFLPRGFENFLDIPRYIPLVLRDLQK